MVSILFKLIWNAIKKELGPQIFDGADHLHDYIPGKSKCIIKGCSKKRNLNNDDAPMTLKEFGRYASKELHESIQQFK